MIKPELKKYLEEKGLGEITERNLGEKILKSNLLENNPKLLLKIIIELEDQSEYTFTSESISGLKNNEPFIPMQRLIDQKNVGIPKNEILNQLKNNMIVDYLE